MSEPAGEEQARASAWPFGLRAAHWLLAASVFAAAGLAFYLLNPPNWSALYLRRYAAGIELHKLFGLAAFLAALALASQHGLRPPHTGSARERQWATLVQGALVFLALAVPAAGYLANAFYGGSIAFPGAAIVRSPLPRNDRLGAILTWAHDIGAYVLLSLVALHVLAALRRQFRRNDPVLTRMLFGRANDKERRT